MPPTLYELMDVPQFCSDEAVLKKAYFKLAKKHHPDRNPENKVEAEQLFKRAAEAYKLLSNAFTRQVYERCLQVNMPEANALQWTKEAAVIDQLPEGADKVQRLSAFNQQFEILSSTSSLSGHYTTDDYAMWEEQVYEEMLRKAMDESLAANSPQRVASSDMWVKHTNAGRSFYRIQGDDSSSQLRQPADPIGKEKEEVGPDREWFEERWALLNPPADMAISRRTESAAEQVSKVANWEMTEAEAFYLKVAMDNWLLPETLQGIRSLFSVFDKSKTGALSAADFEEEEFQSLREKLCQIWTTYKTGFDTNGDEMIEEDEFIAGFVRFALKENFEAFDDPITDSGLAYLTQWIREFNEKIAAMVNAEATAIGADSMMLRASSRLTRISTAANHTITEIGRVSEEELSATGPLLQLINVEQGKMRDELFQMLDRDQNGAIDKNDFTHHIPLHQEKLQTLWKNIQQNFDVSGDHVVTIQEFDRGFMWNAMRVAFPSQGSGEGMAMMVAWGSTFMQNMTTDLENALKAVKAEYI